MNQNILQEYIKEKILVLDGATGTVIQKCHLTAQDFGGPHLEGCNEHLLLTRPDVIASVHEGYLKAGADIIETNTFGSTRIVLADYGLQDKAFDLSLAGAKLAKDLAKTHSTPHKPRFVAGSMGPTTKSIFISQNVNFEELVQSFEEQALGLLQGGVDLLLIETCQDTINIKAALMACDQSMAKAGRHVPVSVSVTIENMGTMLAGQDIQALYYALQHRDLFSIGLNCATGPSFMTDHIRTLSDMSRFPVACVPNAGLPDEEGHYNETPQMIAGKLEKFIQNGWINIIGGCCGTTPEYIKAMADMAGSHKPRPIQNKSQCALSGIESFVMTDDIRPVIVGERANVIGSRIFKNLIVEEKHEEASEVARRQVRAGAHVIDVCLANPDRDELGDMTKFMDFVTRKVKAPFMIDTTDPVVMEEALKKCMGRSIINSINLENGEERFEKVVPLLKNYGAAVVVGCIDDNKEQSMALTRSRKLEVAQRSHKLLTEKHGLQPEDLIFDPLVFPVGTGDTNYIGSAQETIEGIRLIKKNLPRVKTILGISNVSFGLPQSGREVLNAVFLYHCVQAGLDMAIVNSEKLARYPSISEEEKKLAQDLLFSTTDTMEKALSDFTNHFRAQKSIQKTDTRSEKPVEARVAQNVIEGSKQGLFEDLDILLKDKKPLDIVNGPLMTGMAEVGRLFGKNEVIVAEVLQSAEVMKAAVSYLEPHMSHADMSSRGKFLLATVKGDVHDIGKNLVHIILKNNSFQVIDLGIKVSSEDLIKAIQEHRPDMVGLSGLLVKSALQMAATAEDLKNAGIHIPMLVGGAALSEKFTITKITPQYDSPVFYAKDAMTGLDLANKLMDPAQKQGMLEALQKKQAQMQLLTTPKTQAPAPNDQSLGSMKPHNDPPVPPDLKQHVLEDFNVEDIFKYINPVMLYGKHLGLKGSLQKKLDTGDDKARKLYQHVTDLQDEILAKALIKPKAVYQFFPVQSDGNRMMVFDSVEGKSLKADFEFTRQSKQPGLCLSDYVLPKTAGKTDYAAFFVVTCGKNIMPLSLDYREKGDYFKSHALQAIAIESAEAFAELLHERLRIMWGIPDSPDLSLTDKFQAKYQGLRVSFGYPACPRIEDQSKLFALLNPAGTIGVTLTENFMMDPEASVSALVFSHPQAHYFSV